MSTFDYEGHPGTVHAIAAIPVRGPPVTYDHSITAYDADGLGLLGALACSGAMTPPSTYDYDATSCPVHLAHGSRTAQERTSGQQAGPDAFQRTDVAAKAVPEVKPNATVRDLLDIAPGNAREPLKSGLASRRSDSELLDSVLRPRDGTYMTVSRDGALLEGNHRRFELLDRVADPRSSIDWDTPIFLDGWPW